MPPNLQLPVQPEPVVGTTKRTITPRSARAHPWAPEVSDHECAVPKVGGAAIMGDVTDSEHPKCRRCGVPVQRNLARFETFEHMHWLYFHLEFEHAVDGLYPGDPDVARRDPACPARAFDDDPIPNWLDVPTRVPLAESAGRHWINPSRARAQLLRVWLLPARARCASGRVVR